MPKFAIEREIPSIGGASAAEPQSISLKSCGVVRSRAWWCGGCTAR